LFVGLRLHLLAHAVHTTRLSAQDGDLVLQLSRPRRRTPSAAASGRRWAMSRPKSAGA
jgi:hypothetical protein